MVEIDFRTITIPGNVKKLDIKSSQIMIYAIIFDRTWAGKFGYEVNMDELMFWTSTTKRTVLKNIQKLKDKNIITIKNDGLIYLLK